MDSGRSGRTPRSLSSSSSIQDSSIFNDITNLSPIRPCNGPSSHLPPLDYVFGSPCHTSQRGASFTQRPQKSGSADAEQSLKENPRPTILSATQGVSQPSVSQLGVQSIQCPQEHDIKVSKQVQSCSPSARTDELLANPLKKFVCFTESPNSQSNQAIDPSKNLQNDLKGTAAEMLIDDNVEKDMENQLAPTTTLLKKVGHCQKGKKALILGKPTAKGGRRSSGGRADKDVTDLNDANLSTQPASGEQHELHLVDQAAATAASSTTNREPGIVKREEQTSFSSSGFHQLGIEDNLPVKKSTQLGDCDHNPELPPETFNSVQFNDIHNENKRTGNNQIAEYQLHNECKEPDQHHRGICRYCLQFEGVEGGRKSIGSSSSSWNPANIVHSALPPAPPVHPNALNASNAESNMFSRNKRLANFPHHTSSRFPIYPCRILESHTSRFPIYPCRILESHRDKIDISARNNRNSMITGPMPTSIGLHLNRIGNSVSANCGVNVQLTGKDYLSLPGEKSPSGCSHHLSDDSMGQLALVNSFGNSSDKLTAKSESSLAYSVCINIEVDQDESQASMTANSSNISQTVNNLKPLDYSQEFLCESRRTASQDVYAFEEFKQMSPRKKRKEEARSVEAEGCKRCNCKKSRCLKLYCDCFAAGVYCVDSCSCHECLNKIEYEDTVLATRQHIESRNPLAFAPKIVRCVSESPQSSREDANWTIQSSARHKRGCNCKKSMCLKKYCECYQAGVGCSDGCRCEGCKNVFGKKEGSSEAVEVEHRKVVDRGLMDSLSDGKMVVPETQGYISHSGQSISDPSLIAPLYQCSNQDRISSRFRHPAGRHPIASPQRDNSFLSQGNLNCSEILLKEINENAAVTPYYPELHYFDPDTSDLFSPRLKGFADMQSFLTLDQHPQPVPGIQTSSSNRYSSKSSQALLFHPNVLSSASSLHWPCSTFYQNPRSSRPKLVPDPSFEGSLYNILEGECPHKMEAHTTKSENASSADEKHGSPPTNCLDSLTRSVSLPGSGGSRKPIPKCLSFSAHKVHEGSDKRPEGSKTR